MRYLLLVSLLTLATVAHAQSDPKAATPQRDSAQCRNGKKPVPILLKDSFKIKAVNGVSSATARIADFVEFKTMEPIYSNEDVPALIFDKDTPIYAVVTRRNHRHFPLVRGKLEIVLEPLLTWDNQRIEMAIERHSKLSLAESGLTHQEELDKRNKRINKPCEVSRENCVAARGNAEVSILVTAVAGASGAAVSAISNDDDTKFIAATSFFSIAKDLGNLLNGTDVEISKDEIFNLVLKGGSTFCAMPEAPKKKPLPTEVVLVKPTP